MDADVEESLADSFFLSESGVSIFDGEEITLEIWAKLEVLESMWSLRSLDFWFSVDLSLILMA